MSEKCTIYCIDNSTEELLSLVKEIFADASVGVEASGASIQVETNSGSLCLTANVFQERGDKFTKLRFSTYMFFERLSASEPKIKQALLDHVQFCNMIVGIVANNGFASDDRFTEIIFKIAIDLNGLIFNGTEMLDATGKTLMASA